MNAIFRGRQNTINIFEHKNLKKAGKAGKKTFFFIKAGVENRTPLW